jgi:hypothetical protein
MFDINAIVNAAISAAVQQATAPLVERIEKLESCNAESHQRLLVLEGALTDRVVALENNPAQGVDTSVVAGNYTPISNEQVKALLQEWVATGGFVTRDEVEALIEQAIDTHCETYDHDSYDSAVSTVEDHDFDEFVTSDSLDDAVRDAVRNLSFDISVS